MFLPPTGHRDKAPGRGVIAAPDHRHVHEAEFFAVADIGGLAYAEFDAIVAFIAQTELLGAAAQRVTAARRSRRTEISAETGIAADLESGDIPSLGGKNDCACQ